MGSMVWLRVFASIDFAAIVILGAIRAQEQHGHGSAQAARLGLDRVGTPRLAVRSAWWSARFPLASDRGG